jgi:hypothetical protein
MLSTPVVELYLMEASVSSHHLETLMTRTGLKSESEQENKYSREES